MAETLEKALRLVAEEVTHALAVFGSDGALKVANARWLALQGPKPAPERAGISDHLAALGLTPVASRPGIFRRGELEYQVTRLTAGNSTVVMLVALQAEAARDKLRERFLSISSHDIRGPVANVRSYASLLSTGRFTLDEKAQRAVETIARNADRALGLLRSFFDSARAELQPPPVELEPQSVVPLLEAEIERLRGPAQERNVRFHVQFPPNVPEARVDGERFSHIVYALLLHGLSRTPNGGRLELEVRVPDGHLEVAVRDPGPTLSAEALAALFDRDERVVGEGKLGGAFELCLAREEILAHQGTLGHFSPPGGGLELFASLPL